MSAQAGKKGKKKAKAKTVSLNDFLGDSAAPGLIKQIDWADEADDDYRNVNTSLTYQSTSAQKVIQLPTAPRAARSIEIDPSRIPENGPYTAFVGNLPYEVDEYTLQEFFKDLPIVNVRLPEENGRFKGFGYVQFEDKQSLIKALQMNEETLQKRNIRIDVADNQNKDSGSWGRSGGDRYGSQSGPDPTEGNWRKASAEESSREMERRDYEYGATRDDQYGPYNHGDYGYGGGQEHRQYSGNYGRRQPSYSYRGSYRNDGYDGGYTKNSQGYDQRDRNYYHNDRQRYDDGSRNDDRGGYGRQRYNDRGYERRYDDRGGYERRGYSDRAYDRPRQDDRYGGAGRDEPPRERRPLVLQPRQKPLDTSAETTRSSSIFGSAKPVDTATKDREIEEKFQHRTSVEEMVPEKKSSNIFGEAKPIDTRERDREMEEKIAAEKEKILEKAAAKPMSPPARSSVFGDAKPVDTTARDLQIEEKLRKREMEYSSMMNKDPRDAAPRRHSRKSSERSDDGGAASPRRRSRTSSTKSVEEHTETSPSQSKTPGGHGDGRKPEYKPAPAPQTNPWGRKMPAKPPAIPETQAASSAKLQNAPLPTSNVWNRGPPKAERGEREEAEGNSKEDEEEERTPEGAADEEENIQKRPEPGDGSEGGEQPGSYRSGHSSARYGGDRSHNSYQQDRRPPGKFTAGKSSSEYRRRNDERSYHDNRRRGDGDSQTSRSDYGGNANDRGGQGRNKRDGGGRYNRSETAEKKRDSSRDSRPECDRPDAAGQEQPTSGGKSYKPKTKPLPQAEKETPVKFATQSKFALLAMEDSDDDVTAD